MRATKKLIVSALAGAGVLGLTAFPADRALAVPAGRANTANIAKITKIDGNPEGSSASITLASGSDIVAIAARGNTVYVRLAGGNGGGSLAVISVSPGTGLLSEHSVPLLGGVLPAALKGLSGALDGTGQAAEKVISQTGSAASGAGSLINVYSPSGTIANVIHLGDRTLAAGGLAWVGSTLIAVTKGADGLYRVESFVGTAVRKVVPKVSLPTHLPTQLPTALPSGLPTRLPTPKPTKSGTKPSAKLPSGLTLSVPSQATYKPTISVKVHLAAASSNRTVSVYAALPGQSRKLLKKGEVNALGDLTVSYSTAFTTTFTAVYSGDAQTQAKTVSAKTTVVPSMSLSVNGWYATTNVAGTKYLEYHKANNILVDLAVAPDKANQCVWFQVQEYYKVAWRANMKTSCVPLNSASKLSGYLTVANADPGYHYRVAAHYLPAKGDGWNSGAVTGWQYLLPEN